MSLFDAGSIEKVAPSSKKSVSGVLGVYALKDSTLPQTPHESERCLGVSEIPFTLTNRGVYLNRETKEGYIEQVFICSPLYVVSETRDERGHNWGRLLRWHDKDTEEHLWACSVDKLHSEPAEVVGELVRRGLIVSIGHSIRDNLMRYIQSFTCENDKRLRCVTKTGWYGSRYVLSSSEVFGECAGEDLTYQGNRIPDYSKGGTLEEWQNGVARIATGNSRIVFAIASAFAGVLLKDSQETGGGFHFSGQTSKGKTSTLLYPVASVWGKPDLFLKLWRTTSNGLESLCVSRNDNVLILDEIGQADSREVGSAMYMIANGSGKQRMKADTSAREPSQWNTMPISAGELGLCQLMEEAGKHARGGQMIRLPSIPADAGKGMGSVEELHGFAGGAAFSDHMKDATLKYYGAAGSTFLKVLCEPDNLTAMKKEIKEEVLKIAESFEVPEGVAAEVGRVRKRFALVAYAGELASRYGVTGWNQGEATNAAAVCFSAWLNENANGGALGADDLKLLKQVARFLQTQEARFIDPDKPDSEERVRDIAGYIRSDMAIIKEYWVLPEVFKEVCKGFNEKHACTVLSKHGLLKVDGSGKNSQSKSISKFEGQKRVYVLSVDAAEAPEA